jgi:hypothetical protein
MKAQALRTQIEDAIAKSDAFIDSIAKEIKERDGEGIPIDVIRGMITSRFAGCACRAALGELDKRRQ